MVALRSAFARDDDDRVDQAPLPRPDPADWLTLQQAACELNVSISTARRMIRKGKLRNRIVPRPGGFAYLVYLPNSRHANGLGGRNCAGEGGEAGGDTRYALPEAAQVRNTHAPRDLGAYRQSRNGNGHDSSQVKVEHLEQQVAHLSAALSQALGRKQRTTPASMIRPPVNRQDPYARYRWLVRRRRWWPF